MKEPLVFTEYESQKWAAKVLKATGDENRPFWDAGNWEPLEAAGGLLRGYWAHCASAPSGLELFLMRHILEGLSRCHAPILIGTWT